MQTYVPRQSQAVAPISTTLAAPKTSSPSRANISKQLAPLHTLAPQPASKTSSPEDPEPKRLRTPAARPAVDLSLIPVHTLATPKLQTKLTINRPGDEFEQEADRVADQVMRPNPNPASPAARPSFAGAFHPPPIVQDLLRSSGQPLERSMRILMEHRLDRDLKDVRVHTDSRADLSARTLGATAYTVGNHIAFAYTNYSPSTQAGQRLLAHELAHVLQQRGEPRAIQCSPAPTQAEAASIRSARVRGQQLAARVRRHGKLSKEVRATINRDLASLDGEAKEAYLGQVRPALFHVSNMPEIEMQGDPAPNQPAQAPTKPPETDAERAKREYEGMAAFYSSERESQLESNARIQAQYRRDVPNMTASDIDREWKRGDDTFVAVASTPGNKLKAEQLVRIWMRHWNDRDEAGKAEEHAILREEAGRDYDAYIRKITRFYESDAGRDAMGPKFRKAVDDQAMALLMRKNVYEVSIFLQTTDDEGKSHTLEQLDRMAIASEQVKAPFEQIGQAMSMMSGAPMEPDAFYGAGERIPVPETSNPSTAATEETVVSPANSGVTPPSAKPPQSPVRPVAPAPKIDLESPAPPPPPRAVPDPPGMVRNPPTSPKATLKSIALDGTPGSPRTAGKPPPTHPEPPVPGGLAVANESGVPQQVRATGTAGRGASQVATPPNRVPVKNGAEPPGNIAGGGRRNQPVSATAGDPSGSSGAGRAAPIPGKVDPAKPASAGSGGTRTIDPVRPAANPGAGSGRGTVEYEGPALRELKPGEASPKGVPPLTRQQAHLVSELRAGHDVTVPDLKTARALLENMPDVRPHTGAGNFPWETAPKGTSRGDLSNINAPDAPHIHEPGKAPESHQRNPHYNIQFADGTKAAILIVPK